MDNQTQINPELQVAPLTVINSEIAKQHIFPIDNISGDSTGLLEKGAVICGKYTIANRLEVTSGEADLYICNCAGKQYVAKLYKRKVAIKAEVIHALQSIDSPYVAKLYETDFYNGFPIEIIPYYKNGSLQGKPCTYDVIVKMVIPCINEGLKALHHKGIIHKDLKPSNIMLSDNGKSVAIIDFGISSVRSVENTIVVTRTGMTPEYSAPETFRNLFLEESDYYSFGITLFELFNGYTPYANMSPEEIEQYVSVQRIPFPENMPPLLRDFISALTYYDITNRKNKSNPNRRWTYDEVNKWLNGESLIIPGEGIGNIGKGIIPPFIFMDRTYTDPVALVTAFVQNWEEGKKQLFRGNVSAHFRTYNQEIANSCMAAEEEASKTNGRDDIIFWKLLYKINPKLKAFYWRGQMFESLPGLGRDMLERLWKGDKSQYPYYISILSERLLTEYVKMTSPKNESLKRAVSGVEDFYQLAANNHTDMLKTFYMMAYLLSGQKLLYISGLHFRTVGELANYMRNVLDESFESFESLCHKLVDYDGNLDVQLETWLIAIGKRKELDKWRELMNE